MDKSQPPDTMMMNTPVVHTAVWTFCTKMLVRFKPVKNLSLIMVKKIMSSTSRMGMDRSERI